MKVMWKRRDGSVVWGVQDKVVECEGCKGCDALMQVPSVAWEADGE